jgi:hypothetical protein
MSVHYGHRGFASLTLPAAALTVACTIVSSRAWAEPGACLNRYAACLSACDRDYGSNNPNRTGCGNYCFSSYNACLITNPNEFQSRSTGIQLQGGVQKGPSLTLPGTPATPKLQ